MRQFIAVFESSAANPTNRAVTVSVLLSWTNMGGWFRTYTNDFRAALNQGNQNHFRSEPVEPSQKMVGVVFDRPQAQQSPNEWDGEFSIAAIDSPGVEVTY